jgi:hypothetical protein
MNHQFCFALLLGTLTFPLQAGLAAQGQKALQDQGTGLLTFRVRIYNNEAVPEHLLAAATKTGNTVLQKVGLRALWQNCTIGDAHRDATGCEAHPAPIDLTLYLVDRLEDHAPYVHKNALGYSIVPGHGEPATMAYVSYARLRGMKSGFRAEELLGLAMVHEIGHLLLGTNEHANHGLMMADWPRKDVESGSWAEFEFTPSEARRLRAAFPKPDQQTAAQRR